MTDPVRVDGVAPPEEGKALRVTVGATPIAIFNVGGRFYALDARCTHVGGPLDQGVVQEMTVQCPLHGSRFRLDTGAVERGPAARPVRAYRVRFESGGVLLDPVA